MSVPKNTAARIIANRSMRHLHQTLKPLLISAGVRSVEEQIGRPQRFFQRAREQERDALRVSDYLATCTIIDHDPAELLTAALSEHTQNEIRPPRIVAQARNHINTPGAGLGAKHLASLDRLFSSDPMDAKRTIKRSLSKAASHEVPRLLGIYGSALRIESDLAHAALVLQHAKAMAKSLQLPHTTADLLIRMAYVALERQSPAHAIRYAQEGTLGYTRLNDQEGQAKGFLALAMFRYYSQEYHETLEELKAVVERSQDNYRIISAHQTQALCWIGLNQPEKARKITSSAQQLAVNVDLWIRGKLSWLEARLSFGDTRCHHLKTAQTELFSSRPGDSLMVTIELIEELLALGHIEQAGQEIPALCNLVEHAGECRPIQQRVSRLIQHRTRLTPKLVTDLRRGLNQVRDRRLANVVQSD